MNQVAIELRNISKRFGRIQANKNVNLSVYNGEILALLGENGSGKTTLIKLINGLLKEIFNQVEIVKYHDYELVFYQNKSEMNIEELFRTISFDFGKTIYVHEGFNLNPETSGKEFLQYINAFLNTKLTNEIVFSFTLPPRSSAGINCLKARAKGTW